MVCGKVHPSWNFRMYGLKQLMRETRMVDAGGLGPELRPEGSIGNVQIMSNLVIYDTAYVQVPLYRLSSSERRPSSSGVSPSTLAFGPGLGTHPLIHLLILRQ